MNFSSWKNIPEYMIYTWVDVDVITTTVCLYKFCGFHNSDLELSIFVKYFSIG